MMQGRAKYLPVFVFLFLAGCTSVPQNGLQHTNYNATRHVFLANILPPPPAEHSLADRADMNAVLQAQEKRSAAQANEAMLDARLDISRFEPALGKNFTQENLPITFAFFDKVRQDEDRDVQLAKAYYNRPRPYSVHTQVKPIVSHPPNASYPSGHSCFAYVNAILLARMLPEQSQVIYDRANHFAHNRVIAGVHYPTDIEAGKISASVIVHEFLKDPEFIADFNQAKNELRNKLLQP